MPLPPPPPFQPPPSVFNSFQPPTTRSDSYFGNFHIPTQLSSANFGNREQGLSGHIFGSQTQALTREKQKEKVAKDSVKKELDDTIYELTDPSRLGLGDVLLNQLGVEANDILKQKYVNKKREEYAVLEQIKEDYSFDEIKDAFDEGVAPHQLDFFYGGENSNFNQDIEFVSPSNENREFIAFLRSDQGQNLMANNSLSIHNESGDIQNFNTGENFLQFFNLLEIDNALELLPTFQLFYYKNSILPLTNGLLIVPDGKLPEEEKTNLKNLSRGLASMQFQVFLEYFLVPE